jgi:hypothetical protein
LYILDQSLEAGHFALGTMAKLDRHEVRFHGIDRDPIAIQMAQRLITGFKKFSDPRRFSFRTAVADSLFGEMPSGWPKQFHCVLGNPPWKATDRRVMGKTWSRYSPPLKGQFDAYLAFILKAHERVMPGGLISFVVPSSFLSNVSGEPVRQLLLERYDILSLALFPRRSFIEIPCIVPIAFIARKRSCPEDRAEHKTRVFYHPIALGGTKRSREDITELIAPIWRRTPGYILHPLVRHDTEFLLKQFSTPDLSCFGVLSGSRFYRAAGKKLGAPFNGFRARDVRTFHACKRDAEHFPEGSRQFARPPDIAEIKRMKVVFKDVRCVTLAKRLVAASLGPGEFGVGSCSVFLPEDAAQTDFFVALLNSSFANAWYKSRDLGRAIRFQHLRRLPVPGDSASWDGIKQAATRCSQVWENIHNQLETCREGGEDQRLKQACPQQYSELIDLHRQIDQLIFDLFGFSPDQRRAICRLSCTRSL